jgi:hypothetical protein
MIVEYEDSENKKVDGGKWQRRGLEQRKRNFASMYITKHISEDWKIIELETS